MLFIIRCTDKPDTLELRLKVRPAHLDFIAENNARVFIAGPTFAEDGTTMNGSLLIYDAPDLAGAQAFADGDPYAKAGLFADRTITPWRRVIHNADVGKA